MTRAKDISKIITDADFSGTLDVTSTGNGIVRFQGNTNTNTSDLLISHTTSGDSGLQFNSNQLNMFTYGAITFNAGTGNISGGYPANERMRIDSSGNVGIGTTSPTELFEVHGDTPSIKLRDTSAYSAGTGPFISFQGNDSGGAIRNFADIQGLSLTSNNGVLAFSTRSGGTVAERVRITDVGRVGIGTSIPSEKLEINTGTGNIGAKIVSTDSLAVIAFKDNSTTDVQYLGANGNNLVFHAGASPSERMRINAGGNVGIGTTTPAGLFNVHNASGDANAFITSANTNSTTLFFGDTDSTTIGRIQYDHSADRMRFHTNGSERMRIDSNGKVQISSDGVADGFLHIKQNYQTDIGMSLNDTSGSGGTAMRFKVNGSTKGEISFNTTSTTYATSSDHRLKENVTADWDATTRLKQLNPVRFNFIADADRTVDGFLAHEVQSVVPEAISGTHNEVDADGNPVYQGIDQSKLVPLLVKTIQELEARIVALETA